MWTTVLGIHSLLVHVNAAMYVAALEEVEVPGHLGAGVVDGDELIEGDDDELLGLCNCNCGGAYGGRGTTSDEGRRNVMGARR